LKVGFGMANHEKESDDRLMVLTAGGDLPAFEELLRRYEKRVLNYAYRILADAGAAEDVLQQTFLNLFESAGTYTPEGKFPAYLFRIARNLSLNESARQRPKTAPDLRPLRTEADPAGYAVAREERDRVRKAVASLGDKDREIVWLRVYQKMPYKQIAELVGIKEDTARSRMRYALEALARVLAKKK